MPRLAPLLVLMAVVALHLAGHGRYIVLTLTVVSPMLAAILTGPRITTVYALAALLLASLLGVRTDLYNGDYGGGPAAQAIRLAGVAVGGVIAVVASHDRTRRETKLREITRVAEVAQRAILSAVPASSGGLRLAASYESAAAEASVGGDLYEVVNSMWGTRILVGDVRGKGLDAIQIASRVLGCFRVVARNTDDPAGVVAALDGEVVEVAGPEDFVTAVFAQIDQGRLLMVNAGHPDPVLLRNGVPRLVPVAVRQPPLGLGTDGAAIARHQLERGDRLLFYTDGLTEARNPGNGEFFPLIPAVESALRQASLDDCLVTLVRELRRWTTSSLNDDVALLVAEVVSEHEDAAGGGEAEGDVSPSSARTRAHVPAAAHARPGTGPVPGSRPGVSEATST
ncbi:Stage II sporulation protein E (SpoIIE) [Candidatus Protofrankia californiensis]|uniref:Stage II sporulation protein E (SpoIIE) n=1 Tax=Candidatus Protofrankia californiensis TaxID=1839754 RepID=A0A1C3P123_9ACTN|nr:Stage II sporulation protein E (SpoIIE) [Candidatus Protofrankia californiensis]